MILAPEAPPAPLSAKPKADRAASQASKRERTDSETRARAPAAEQEPAPEKPKAAEVVDRDFDQLFGDDDDAPPEPAKRSKKGGRTVYVPPAPGSGTAPETLGPADIMEVVRANLPGIKRCFDEHRSRTGESGTLVMRWRILKNGTVQGARAATAGLQGSPLEKCLASRIALWRFPTYTGHAMDPIEFPFKY